MTEKGENINSPDSIIKRLNSLRLWQQEQQKLLFQKQSEQFEQQNVILNELESSTVADVNADAEEFGDYDEENSFLEKMSKNTNKENICTDNRKAISKDDVMDINKRRFLKRGEGLQSRFKVHPDTFRLDNLPKYKYANSHKQFLPKNKRTKEVVKKVDLPKQPPKMTLNLNSSLETKQSHDKDSSTYRKEESSFKHTDPISWAKVLDPSNLEAVEVKDIRSNFDSTIFETSGHNDTDSLSIFELLEKKSQDANYSLNASNIRKWLQQKAIALVKETEAAAVDEAAIDAIKKSRILPYPCDIDSKLIPQEDEDEYEEIEEEEDDEDEDEDEESKPLESEFAFDSEDRSSKIDRKMHHRQTQHVRFNDNVQVNEVESETETVKSFEAVHINRDDPNNSDFQRFKTRLFAGSNEESILSEISTSHPNRDEINAKSEALKNRLSELECEIATFKQQNSELIKIKQNHELQKIQLEQDYFEKKEKLNDEKIKMEIYLHDERIKIEDEKQKLKKLIKDQRVPNRKERDEIIALKEQIENLQKENKMKEGKHISAQSRLRAQIRNLEKEIKDLTFEFEHLRKENKKLESENSRLNRLNNNKMLQEINKTIEKLVPKAVESPVVTEVRNRNMKPVVAKVISHNKSSKMQRSLKRVSSGKNDENVEDFDFGESSDESLNEPAKINIQHSQRMSTSSNSNNETQSAQKQFKREIRNSDGSTDIWYPNGNLKKISSDGMNIRMLYFNKDIKETNITDGTVKYYYAETNTWHTTYLDGLEILEFPNGETEHRYKDGTVEIHFPNGSIRISNPLNKNTSEEWRYSDGTNLIQLKNGDKILTLPNGQKEIHTKIHKRREYPDGTIKLVYPDGSQETRYSNGRIRLKDKDGNLVMDSADIKY